MTARITPRAVRAAHYLVRGGETLADVAERCYGDRSLWPALAEANPLARAGVLYEGQRLTVPPPGQAEAAPARGVRALPLGHAPLKIRLDGATPLFQHDGFGAIGVGGLSGELTFYRHGRLRLAELSPARLHGYRLEQIAWAKGLFLKHFCGGGIEGREGWLDQSDGSHPAVNNYYFSGPDYTIAGRISSWQVVRVHSRLTGGDAPSFVHSRLAVDPLSLFASAALVLGDPGDRTGALLPLGRVLRAACPELISPATLWGLTRDPGVLYQPRGVAVQRAETSTTAPKAKTRKRPVVTKPKAKKAVATKPPAPTKRGKKKSK